MLDEIRLTHDLESFSLNRSNLIDCDRLITMCRPDCLYSSKFNSLR
ncbi:hypothetical protein VCHA39O220_10103 [Vibrio chagasii]|nr:hypothetical protein VCHA39O220_10103 [Vibrio chagasii]